MDDLPQHAQWFWLRHLKSLNREKVDKNRLTKKVEFDEAGEFDRMAKSSDKAGTRFD